MEEQTQEIIESRKKYPVETLHRVWMETEPLPKGPDFGNYDLNKMARFGFLVTLNNLDIDYWMSIKPARIEEESYEDYKIRQKFQRALLKYRPFIYDYPIMTQKKLKAEMKRKKREVANG